MTSQTIEVREYFVCASCGGRFTYRHECPVRLSTSAPTFVNVEIRQFWPLVTEVSNV